MEPASVSIIELTWIALLTFRYIQQKIVHDMAGTLYLICWFIVLVRYRSNSEVAAMVVVPSDEWEYVCFDNVQYKSLLLIYEFVIKWLASKIQLMNNWLINN